MRDDDLDDLYEMYGAGTEGADAGPESGADGSGVTDAPLDAAMRAASATMRGGVSFGEGNHYEWDPPSGRLYYLAIKKDRKGIEIEVATEVMTFHPELHTIVEYGDDSPPIWLVRLTSRTGEVVDATMREKDRQTRYAAESWLANVADPGLFEIVVGQEIHFLKAIKASGVGATRIVVPSHAGWQENTSYPMFIAPGMTAAISKNGLDTAIRWLPDDLKRKKLAILSASFAPYGQGVRPPATDAERVAAWVALEHLRACANIEVMFPLLMAVLGGPLRAHALKENAPWVHLYGTTGHFKLSVTEAALSIFGKFARVGTVGRSPESFSSTYAALATALNVLADLPVLIDDFKAGTSKMRADELDSTCRRTETTAAAAAAPGRAACARRRSRAR